MSLWLSKPSARAILPAPCRLANAAAPATASAESPRLIPCAPAMPQTAAATRQASHCRLSRLDSRHRSTLHTRKQGSTLRPLLPLRHAPLPEGPAASGFQQAERPPVVAHSAGWPPAQALRSTTCRDQDDRPESAPAPRAYTRRAWSYRTSGSPDSGTPYCRN